MRTTKHYTVSFNKSAGTPKQLTRSDSKKAKLDEITTQIRGRNLRVVFINAKEDNTVLCLSSNLALKTIAKRIEEATDTRFTIIEDNEHHTIGKSRFPSTTIALQEDVAYSNLSSNARGIINRICHKTDAHEPNVASPA